MEHACENTYFWLWESCSRWRDAGNSRLRLSCCGLSLYLAAKFALKILEVSGISVCCPAMCCKLHERESDSFDVVLQSFVFVNILRYSLA
jgi:hypothetical protein